MIAKEDKIKFVNDKFLEMFAKPIDTLMTQKKDLDDSSDEYVGGKQGRLKFFLTCKKCLGRRESSVQSKSSWNETSFFDFD